MRHAYFAALVALLATTPATAKSKTPEFVVAKAIGDSKTVTLDKAKAYVLFRSDMQLPLHFMKVPTAADQEVYSQLRAAALAESREKYTRKVARYNEAVQANAKPGARKMPSPDKPIEPTKKNFEYAPFGQLAAFTMGPLSRFAKGEGGASTYLHEVTPAEYRIYGSMSETPNGNLSGSCFCLGSVAFTARAGEITDLGSVRVRETLAPPGSIWAPKTFFASNVAPLDPRLTGMVVTPVSFRPVGKLPNYFGAWVSRLPPIAGVMRYDRDRIIDLTGGAR